MSDEHNKNKNAKDDAILAVPSIELDDTAEEHELGLAGRMARAFIHSPITPLLFFAMLAMGLMGLLLTPRQEDPQISVPMIDIYVQYPGATATEVASLAIEPLERIMSEIPGVKHVYSAAERGQGMVTVRFVVGEELGPSIVKVHDKIQSNMDKMPPGVRPPLVKPVGIDDVPVVALTLWSENLDQGQLRTLSNDVLQRLKEIPDTGSGFVVGGLKEQIRVQVRPERLSGYNVSLDQVAHRIRSANSEQKAGDTESSGRHFTVYTGSFLRTAADVANLVITSRNGSPVYVRDIADVTEEPEEPKSLVTYYSGHGVGEEAASHGMPAVTIAIAKKVGSNGVTVAENILNKIKTLRDDEIGLITPDVHVEITRNYGETARNKVNSLIKKLFIATGAVTILVWLFLGWRPALVVTLVIPVVLLMTVFAAWIGGFTIDRVSLFALIFSIGILVDDAIVVIENIYRRWLEKGVTDTATAIDAVREVGNPTILATFTVVAALMPMAFVSGLMGPYMSPIPMLGSVAMIISLFAAFVFVPYLAMRIKPGMAALHKAEEAEHRDNERVSKVLDRSLVPLIEDNKKGKIFLFSLIVVFFLVCAFFLLKWVPVKMLPFDNKPEFSVVINMPSGTALPATANLTNMIAERIRDGVPYITAMQTYVGTAKPFDFNGMVRHYYLRDKPWQSEIQVQLTNKNDRAESSHELAVMARRIVDEIVADYKDMSPVAGKGVRTTVVEMPPGPPVLQTVVAEIYGPDAETRRDVANQMTQIFQKTEGMADVDNYLQDEFEVWRFEVDADKAVRRGISVDTINRNLSMALGENRLGDIKRGSVLEPTFIVLEIPLSERSDMSSLGDLPIPVPGGQETIPLAELGTFVHTPQDQIIYHKDLRPVEYVVGDAVGRLGAPIYPMLKIDAALQLEENKTIDGENMKGEYFGAPKDTGRSAFEWGGEWTVTYETFRDMGLAFGVALIVIYILVVWEFGNFIVPAIIMAPIPLTLLGIIPGHIIAGFAINGTPAEFTATSMIGFIALAGIIVRNSILLVDFAIHEVRDGKTNAEAVVEACKARTRPIVITALALVAGSFVILTDPIFQGMAISLLFGVLVSSVLTLVVIPLGCISAGSYLCPECQKLPPGLSGEPDDSDGSSGGGWIDTVWARVSTAGIMGFFMLRAVAIMAIMAIKAGWKKTSSSLNRSKEKALLQAEKIQSEIKAREQKLKQKQAAESAAANAVPETVEAIASEPEKAVATKRQSSKTAPAKSEKKTATKKAEKKAAKTRTVEPKQAKTKSKQTKSSVDKAEVAHSTPKTDSKLEKPVVVEQPEAVSNKETVPASVKTADAKEKVAEQIEVPEEKPVPVIKKRVARKKKVKAAAMPTTRKRPAVRAKTSPAAEVSSAVKPAARAKTAEKPGTMVTAEKDKTVTDKTRVSKEKASTVKTAAGVVKTPPVIPAIPQRNKSNRRGIRLNPNI